MTALKEEMMACKRDQTKDQFNSNQGKDTFGTGALTRNGVHMVKSVLLMKISPHNFVKISKLVKYSPSLKFLLYNI